MICLHVETTGPFAWVRRYRRGLHGFYLCWVWATTSELRASAEAHALSPLIPVICSLVEEERSSVCFIQQLSSFDRRMKGPALSLCCANRSGKPHFPRAVHRNAAVGCCEEESKLMIAVIPTMLMICRKMN